MTVTEVQYLWCDICVNIAGMGAPVQSDAVAVEVMGVPVQDHLDASTTSGCLEVNKASASENAVPASNHCASAPDHTGVLDVSAVSQQQLSPNSMVETTTQTELLSKQIQLLQDQLNLVIVEKVKLKEKLTSKEMTEDFFQGHDERVWLYTGLNSYHDLEKLFNFIKNFISLTARSALTPFQQMMLTLMKLSNNFPLQDLAIRFDISTGTASKIFQKILCILYARTKSLVRWPTREELQLSMPMCFREH